MHAGIAVGRQFRGGARDTRRAQVLNGLHHACVEQLEAAFDQHFFHEGVADLHRGTLGGHAVVESFRRQNRRAADAVATGACTEQHHQVAFTGRVRQVDIVVTQHAQAQGVDQRVALVGRVELGFSADVRQAQAVAVSADTGHHAVHDTGRVRVVECAETQLIHHGYRACTHRHDVADDAAHTCGSTLVGLHE